MTQKSTALSKTEKILSKYLICDECLGRQFAQILSGYNNKQRGNTLRTSLAIEIDSSKKTPENKTLLKNLSTIKFRNIKNQEKEDYEKNCQICNGIFHQKEEIVKNMQTSLKNYEFETFEIGITLSEELTQKEEDLWELAGIEHCESIKTNLSRVLGKKLSETMKKEVSHKKPDIQILLDLSTNQINLNIKPLFIYGKYNKYAQIPQTKWICLKCKGKGCSHCNYKGKLYETSVEEEISKYFKELNFKTTKFHGAGREDIDVQCLGWREFVIEFVEPKKRSIDLKKIEKEINKNSKVNVKELQFTDRKKVKEIKQKTSKKIYEVEINITKEQYSKIKQNLDKLEKLKNKTINQQTPQRVSHRRADKIRKRKIYDISVKELNTDKLTLEIKTQSGTYIKELISGDNGRTRPSLTSLFETPLKLRTLKVIGFED